MSTTVTGTDTDALCINTIRGLCMDAVQQANSGHPGTPMGVAPVAYTLWQRFLRFDPSDPIWPNRDRFVLSEGHASTLLWSLLHLTRVQAVDADYEVLGRPAVTMQDLRTFRQLDSHCPGHPEYRWTSGVETTTGPLGPGCRDFRRDGDVGRMARGPLQRGRTRSLRLRRLRSRRRRLHDGGSRLGGGVARRAPGTVEVVLDLRLEPSDDRGAHRHRLHRGSRVTVHRVRMERDDRGRRQRSRLGRPCLPHVPDRAGAADVDRGAQPHRLRIAGRGLSEGPRRAPGGRGGASGEAVLRPPRGRGLLRAGRRLRSVRDRAGGQGEAGAGVLGGHAGRLQGVPSRAGGRARPDATTGPARGLGEGVADLPARRGRSGQPRLFGAGAERAGPGCALARRRVRRSVALHQDRAWSSRARAISRASLGRAGTCTSGSASTPRPRSPTAWR